MYMYGRQVKSIRHRRRRYQCMSLTTCTDTICITTQIKIKIFNPLDELTINYY